MLRTVSELRLNGITSGDLKKGCFIHPRKEADMQLILAEYEKTLEEQKLIDNERLMMMAIEQLKQGGVPAGRKYFILSRHYLCGIERAFLETLCGKDLIVIEEDPAIGFPVPSDTWFAEEVSKPLVCGSDIERLRWLFQSEAAPKAFKDGTIELFSAIGYRNEVREVLGRISAEKGPVDDVEVIYTDPESYSEIIYSLCEKLKIPATFADGQSIFMTAAGRTFMGFLLWVKEDFSEIHLRHILESSGLGDVPGSTTLAFLLRTAGIGWGRDRYATVLNGQILKSQQEAADLRKEGEIIDAERKDAKAGNLAALKAVCEDLIKLVPPKEKDGRIDFTKFCEGCFTFLDKHMKKTDDNDAAFAGMASDRLKMLSALIKGPMVFDEAVEKISNAICGIRVGASGPKPGHLHVSQYRKGGRSGRNRTFIVGLDEGKFPAKSAQDPVLLDEERAKISKGLELSTDRMSKNIYDMASLIAGLRGKVTFSYSAYDIKDDRKAFPAAILLQVFRIRQGDPGADYDAMLSAIGEPAGFDQSYAGKTILDETDWWLARLIEDGVLKDALGAVQETHEGIEPGLHARTMRAGIALTAYDGKITPHGSDLDPRENTDRVMSCSRLESAAKCPFAYFVENVLRVRKPDEVEKDEGAWLDAAERGKLLHEVFQIFINKRTGSKATVSALDEAKDIEKILNETIVKYKTLVPPPGEIVFQNECVQLKRDVGVFLHINRELGTEPVGAEMAFGFKKDDAVKIPLGNGKHISLRGSIDRVDKAGTSEYRVWDYKTGGTYSYKDKGFIAGGTQIQHALYAIAAEEILKQSGQDKNAKVISAGYLFPTEKGTKDGQGGIFSRSTNNKDLWQSPLNKLLDLIATGTFVVNNKDVCIFCDYKDICGGATARDSMDAKMENIENKALEDWKLLKEYD